MISPPTRGAMVKTLASEDIRDLLASFAAAIELDQLRVDALPPQKFHPWYNDSMWRSWPCEHILYINKLLVTVDTIPVALLEELTRMATTCEPAVVAQFALDLFADAASGSCPQEEVDTAALFFGCLIQQLRGSSEGKPIGRDAKALMLRWLPVTDPLRIAHDSECGYGQPMGLVS
jgi:hypothetical protein